MMTPMTASSLSLRAAMRGPRESFSSTDTVTGKPCRWNAASSSSTGSRPSAPSHAKPLLQYMSVPLLIAVCCMGKENVKASAGECSAARSPSSSRNVTIARAIKSKRASAWDVKRARGSSISRNRTSGRSARPLNVTRRTRKLVPPISRARKVPRSSPVGSMST